MVETHRGFTANLLISGISYQTAITFKTIFHKLDYYQTRIFITSLNP